LQAPLLPQALLQLLGQLLQRQLVHVYALLQGEERADGDGGRCWLRCEGRRGGCGRATQAFNDDGPGRVSACKVAKTTQMLLQSVGNDKCRPRRLASLTCTKGLLLARKDGERPEKERSRTHVALRNQTSSLLL